MPQRPLNYRTPPPILAKAKIGPLTAGAVVLMAYPFCLIANVMSFAAAPAQGASPRPVPLLASQAFLWSSTLYPLVYLVAAGTSRVLASNDRTLAAHRVAQVPLVYLVGVVPCFLAWVVAA